MTRLRGHDVLAPDDLDRFLDDLATTLHAVHAVADPGDHLGTFVPYNLGVMTKPPAWTRRASAWERAIEIAHEPVPDAPAGLCHRDFHPGNVLWSRGKVTGVVDWTHACRGPAAVDVSHCRINLALLFGLDAADRFARSYGDVDALAWFDLSDAVGMGDHEPEVWRFHDAGRTDLTIRDVIDGLDAFVVEALARLAG
jgi:aminoglycoside phosphotransferase (APT) family kinase protein